MSQKREMSIIIIPDTDFRCDINYENRYIILIGELTLENYRGVRIQHNSTGVL